jgi:hypothetical protein
MISFLEHLEKIFEFLLKETPPENLIDILHQEITDMTESCMILRDTENFIAYFKCILSIPRIPKKMEFRRDLVQAFIDRTYTGLINNALDYRVERLYEYVANEIDEGTEITEECLNQMAEELNKMKKPNLERVMERIRVATILKWLQGPLNDRLSHELQDRIIFLATVYGQYKKNLLINVEWQPFQVSAEDMNILVSEYRFFEIAIIEALQIVRDARAANPDLSRYEEQFQIVLSSLDNLVKLEEAGKLDSFDSFKDRLIVSTALIYIQDDFIEKDAELKKLIQLFVSLYFKYRDKRHESEASVKSNRSKPTATNSGN